MDISVTVEQLPLYIFIFVDKASTGIDHLEMVYLRCV